MHARVLFTKTYSVIDIVLIFDTLRENNIRLCKGAESGYIGSRGGSSVGPDDSRDPPENWVPKSKVIYIKYLISF